MFDEAKEATKEAAKRVSKEAAKRVSKEAAKEAKEAAMSSTSIANGAVICCGRPNCQGTQKYTGASWSTHQFAKRKQIRCTSCGKKLEASKWVVVAA